MKPKTKQVIYFKFIESCLLIKEHYKSNMLMESFFLARVSSSVIMREYLNFLGENNLRHTVKHDTKRKEYRTTEDFKPQLIKKRQAALFLSSIEIVFRK